MVAAGLALTVSASLVTGPTFDEERRVNAVRHAIELVHAIADYGPSTMVSSSARAIYEELTPFGVLPGLVSAWVVEALARPGVLDRLVAARLGWLLITGLAPAAVYFIVEASRGARVGVVAACLLMAMPRWTHAAAVAHEHAVVASIWLLAVAAYVRGLPHGVSRRRDGTAPRRSPARPLFGIVVGLGLATDVATLWVLPLIVAHYWTLRGAETRLAFRRGRAPLPTAFLWLLGLGPLALALGAPQLWRGGAAGAAEWLFAPAAPTIEPAVYLGAPVIALRDVPPGYALRWLLATLPVASLVLFVAGAAVLFLDFRASRRGVRPRDRTGLGLLVAFAGLASVVGPALAPRNFTLFPPRIEAVLPYVAVASAVALDRLAIRLVGERRGAFAAMAAAAAFLAVGLVGLPTASASFGLLAGGTRGAVRSRMWTVGDGSEVAVLARALDSLGVPRVTIDSSDVPRGYWAMLGQVGRVRVHVELGRSPSGLAVVRGERSGAIATVSAGGATLWSLVKR